MFDYDSIDTNIVITVGNLPITYAWFVYNISIIIRVSQYLNKYLK